MEVKKETPSKVVIIPRPPRCAAPDQTPIDSAAPATAQPQAESCECETVAPGETLNNQVQGPNEGLAGTTAEQPKK